MEPNLLEDLKGVLDGAVRDGALVLVVLFDEEGTELAHAGDETRLADEARDLFLDEARKRIALSLDEDEPEYAPSARETGGHFVYFARADHYLLGAATTSPSRQAFDQAVDKLVRRVEGQLAFSRKDRRTHFRAHRAITRVCDKRYVMSAEVRRLLSLLCDLLLDIEDALSAHEPTATLARRFLDTLAELVARPKNAGEAFQANLESLQESAADIADEPLDKERLRALTSGLELTINAWPEP